MLTSFCNLLRTYDCSALPRIFSPGTMASADFLPFVVTAHFFEYVGKTSPGTHTFFPSLPAAFTANDSV